MTRQRAWQLDRISRGLCGDCGKRRLNLYAERCDRCAGKLRRYLTPRRTRASVNYATGRRRHRPKQRLTDPSSEMAAKPPWDPERVQPLCRKA